MRLLLLALPWLAAALAAQIDAAPDGRSLRERVESHCRAALDRAFARGKFPGGSAAVILPDGSELAFTVGLASVEDEQPMRPGDRLCSGSVGKTYVAAAALHLVAQGKLALTDTVASHLGEEPWFSRLPNAAQLTVRDLLRHTTGIPRYVFHPELWRRLRAEPDKVWKPEELLAFVFDAKPLFAPGEGWAYADTNYIVLGMILERVAGVPIHDYIGEHLLAPHGLRDTVPSDRRRIPGLIQGYVGVCKAFGLPDRVLEDGVFVINPQFEWCGGGYANTPLDLARWARILYSGHAFDGDYLGAMLDTVPASMFGKGGSYGLGVIRRETEAGPSLGHDGVFPGYLSAMTWFPERRVAAALQVNRDGEREAGVDPHALLITFAGIVERESQVK